ncbi:uncharacterized protein LOC134699528 [Mytilus trossulus]|uniref:uncharacterized protein LOC134699528 n=1 Tax=Mytilus trossulus TaxID=6551 RepID=UPI0030058C5E
MTPLMLAARGGHLEVVTYLVTHGSQLEARDTWYGKTPLMFAAGGGHLEVVTYLVTHGSQLEATSTMYGKTPLMFAAGGGHLEVVTYLVTHGSQLEATSTMYGMTPLLLAAWGGHLEVVTYLVSHGSQLEATDTTVYGYRALHYAAGNGDIDMTKFLIDQGCSPWKKTKQGKTPYDIVTIKSSDSEEKKRKKKEVMDFLKSVISEKSSEVTSGLEKEDGIVPTEIKLMADKRSIDLYLKLLESGSEKKRDIRLVVVGKKGAGKTSLIRRLFGEDITDVTSTNGIEIHKIKCKAMSDDGIWNKLDENYEETQARLLKEYMGKLQDKRTIQEQEESQIAFKDNTPVTSVDESKKSETASKQTKIRKPPTAVEPQPKPQVTPQQSSQSSEQAARDFETMLTAKSKVDVHDKEEYATFLLWDFAGDEEFYHTHQTFLSQDAMYLVVTKLNEADDPNAQALFRLWIDSIHCYSRLEEKNIISDDKTTTSDDLDPPVVIVGTWKDAVTSEADTVEEACRESLLVYTENLADDERGHVRSEYFISNKEDDHSVFQQIRRDIINSAREMRTWNKDYPLKFIQLEQRLQEKKKELPIITYQEIKHISTDTPKPLTDEELILFLEFHHELRSLVYFEDLPDNIILDTQWLSDAFKCIVTARKFQASTKNQKRWNEFYHTGKLNYDVLEDIFKKETTILYENKDYILNVMEKFDIIIRSNKSGADVNPYYYVPSMIRAEPERDIYEMFNVPKDICKRSTWLCFRFRFLPPHLMNHLIASLSRKYTVAEVVDSKKKKRQIALFKGTAVFELQHETTKLRKLLVMTCPNVIQIQVWEFGEDIKGGLYKYIDDFVTEELNTIMHTRFKMSNVKFEKKWECGLTEPKCVTGSNMFMEEPIYQCDTCQIKHMFIDEWSDQQNKAPWVRQRKQVNSNKIRENESRIIQDIQISQILDHMMTHLVISADDRREIEHYPRQDDQNKALLDIVIKRKEPVYSVFVDGLRNYGYEDIANDLKYHSQEMSPSTTSASSETEGLSAWNVPLYKVQLQKNYLKVITDLQHENIVDHLITKEVMSVDDGKNIESGKTPQEKNRNLMDMLLRKNERGFNEFLKALRKDSIYVDLADHIQKTEVTSTDMATLYKCLK